MGSNMAEQMKQVRSKVMASLKAIEGHNPYVERNLKEALDLLKQILGNEV
jgi:hypothetical protein